MLEEANEYMSLQMQGHNASSKFDNLEGRSAEVPKLQMDRVQAAAMRGGKVKRVVTKRVSEEISEKSFLHLEKKLDSQNCH